jgi:alpha 1,2-mannosyltransferase
MSATPAVNAAICYLTQNTEARRMYLKTSLYFLFKFFNEKYRYPVILFHEGDYDSASQEEIITSIRASCRDLVSFQALDANDFKVPDHIDKVKLKRILDITPPPTPYWRNEKYRLMCRWWMMNFMKYVKNYDYVMRLDDDSFMEEPITKDLFAWMKEEDLNYASNLLHVDCGICSYGMKDFFEKEFPEKKEMLQEMFIPQEIPMRSVTLHPFRTILSLTQNPLPPMKEVEKIWMPVMYYNNFFVTKTAFWETPEMKETLEKIDKNGSIFYFRWGDSPLQSILAMLYSKPEQISKASFAYSKRLQREAFKGDDGHFHPYMPENYTKTSCITEQPEIQEKLAKQKL